MCALSKSVVDRLKTSKQTICLENATAKGVPNFQLLKVGSLYYTGVSCWTPGLQQRFECLHSMSPWWRSLPTLTMSHFNSKGLASFSGFRSQKPSISLQQGRLLSSSWPVFCLLNFSFYLKLWFRHHFFQRILS